MLPWSSLSYHTELLISGEDLSLEDTYHLQSLLQKLKMIEKRQATLQEYVEADVKKVMHHFTLTYLEWMHYTAPNTAIICLRCVCSGLPSFVHYMLAGCSALLLEPWLSLQSCLMQKQGENEAAIAVKNARQKEAMQIVKEKAARPATMQVQQNP